MKLPCADLKSEKREENEPRHRVARADDRHPEAHEEADPGHQQTQDDDERAEGHRPWDLRERAQGDGRGDLALGSVRRLASDDDVEGAVRSGRHDLPRELVLGAEGPAVHGDEAIARRSGGVARCAASRAGKRSSPSGQSAGERDWRRSTTAGGRCRTTSMDIGTR